MNPAPPGHPMTRRRFCFVRWPPSGAGGDTGEGTTPHPRTTPRTDSLICTSLLGEGHTCA